MVYMADVLEAAVDPEYEAWLDLLYPDAAALDEQAGVDPDEVAALFPDPAEVMA